MKLKTSSAKFVNFSDIENGFSEDAQNQMYECLSSDFSWGDTHIVLVTPTQFFNSIKGVLTEDDLNSLKSAIGKNNINLNG